jgi:hypothetical protein
VQLVAAAMKPSIHSFCYVLLGFFFLCAFSLWICASSLLRRLRFLALDLRFVGAHALALAFCMRFLAYHLRFIVSSA